MKNEIITKRKKRIAIIFLCLIFIFQAFPIVGCTSDNTDNGAGSTSGQEISDDLEATETEAEEYLYGNYLKPIKGLEPLPIGLIAELNKNNQGFTSINVLNIGLVLSDRYLGYINDHYVFFNTSVGSRGDGMTATEADSLHVAGYDFFYSSPFSIILYHHKSGTKMLLEDAYESGIITIDTVRKIYQRNNEYIRYFSPELNFQDKKPITDEEFESVRQAWIKEFGSNDFLANSYKETNGECMEFYFYGWIGDNIVFHAGNPEYTGPNQWNEFDIEGNKFTTFPRYMNIWVYCDGEIMLLLEAYEKDIVQSDDLSTISYMNQCICGG